MSISRKGFTLVEVILAIGIFAFAMVVVLGLVSRGLQTNREARMEGVSAILAGQINSLLKAPYAWGTNSTNNPILTNFLGARNLGQIAGGTAEVRTNFYTQDLVLTNSTDAGDFQVVTRIQPVSQGFVNASEPTLNDAISRLSVGAHCVNVAIEISYPAKAPEQNRSKRHLSSILTRTTDE
jgi:prepilin-type N-terminal cleavage/methylation domain-containing protein